MNSKYRTYLKKERDISVKENFKEDMALNLVCEVQLEFKVGTLKGIEYAK